MKVDVQILHVVVVVVVGDQGSVVVFRQGVQ